MPADVSISFEGDISNLRAKMNEAGVVVSSAHKRMETSASEAVPELRRLQEQIDRLNESSARSAEASEGLKRYADIGMYLKILSSSYEVVRTAQNIQIEMDKKIVEGVRSTVAATSDLISRYGEYAKSQAYVASSLPLVEVAQDGVTAALGRFLLMLQQEKNYRAAATDGTAQSIIMASAAAGQYGRMADATTAAGMSLTKYYASLSSILMKNTNISESDSGEVLRLIASIPEASMSAQTALTALAGRMSSSGEAAKQFARDYSEALSNLTGGKAQAIMSAPGVSDNARKVYEDAKVANDQHAMTAAIMQTIVDKYKALAQAQIGPINQTEALHKKIMETGTFTEKLLNYFGGASAKEKEYAANYERDLQEQIRLIQEVVVGIDRTTDSMRQAGNAAKDIVASLNPLSSQFDVIAGKMSNLSRASSGGAASSLRDIIAYAESGNRNIRQHGGGPASGYFQIEDDTWKDFRDRAGAGGYRTAMDAPYDVQWAVAQQIPLKRWAPTTVNAVKSVYPGIDTGQTVGALSGQLNSGDSRKAVEAETQLAEAAQRVKDAMEGGNAVAKAQADIAARHAAGQKDEVKDAELMVAAWTKLVAQRSTATVHQAAVNGLNAANTALEEKKAAVESSRLSLSMQDKEVLSQKLSIAQKQYDLAVRMAGGDEARINAAKQSLAAVQDAKNKDDLAQAKVKEEGEYQIAMDSLNRRRTLLKEEVQLHEMSATSKLQADLALETEREDIERRHLQFQLSQETEGTAGYVRAQTALTVALQHGLTQRENIVSQNLKGIEQGYQQTFGRIGNTVSSSIMGMIQGTANFHQMIVRILNQILSEFISMGVRQVTNWAAAQAAKLSITTATAKAGAAVEKASTASTIASDAAKAGAGAYAAVAQIPIIGPVLAPVAAATAFAATSAFGSFDVGSWSVPKDQLAMVHAGEMIVPTRGGVAEEFRGMLGGGSQQRRPGDNHFHIGVTAMDGASVRSVLMNNKDALAAAFKAAMRDGHVKF